MKGIGKEAGNGEYINHVEETAERKRKPIYTVTGMKQRKMERE